MTAEPEESHAASAEKAQGDLVDLLADDWGAAWEILTEAEVDPMRYMLQALAAEVERLRTLARFAVTAIEGVLALPISDWAEDDDEVVQFFDAIAQRGIDFRDGALTR